jgi:cobalt-zinc-cadmium efflux system protein
VAAIGWDAIGKLQNPQPVGGKQVMIVAGIGVVINTFTAVLFMKGQKHDLNIRAAFLHMAADAAVSLGVVISGLLILLTGKNWIDPVMSFIIIAVILWGTWQLFSDSVNLALDAVPKNIDVEKVRNFIAAKNGVENLHDLHIWAMSTTQIALTAHLVMPGGNDDRFITTLQNELKEKFNIGHTTFQIENRNLEQNCDTDC